VKQFEDWLKKMKKTSVDAAQWPDGTLKKGIEQARLELYLFADIKNYLRALAPPAADPPGKPGKPLPSSTLFLLHMMLEINGLCLPSFFVFVSHPVLYSSLSLSLSLARTSLEIDPESRIPCVNGIVSPLVAFLSGSHKLTLGVSLSGDERIVLVGTSGAGKTRILYEFSANSNRYPIFFTAAKASNAGSLDFTYFRPILAGFLKVDNYDGNMQATTRCVYCILAARAYVFRELENTCGKNLTPYL